MSVVGASLQKKAETAGTGTTSDGKPYNGDMVSPTSTAANAFTGTFARKDVVNGIVVAVTGNTLNGAQAADYVLSSTNEQPGITANITPKTLTVTGLTANNKIYDA